MNILTITSQGGISCKTSLFNTVSSYAGNGHAYTVLVDKKKSMYDKSNWITFNKPGVYNFTRQDNGEITWTYDPDTSDSTVESGDICFNQYQ